ncbi:alpha/beta hydrolase [Corallococcus terminator]|uniref:Alpha/beta fold hydrolase n=1 Tax=Corallococcus terminator TaxID=2316733 RepID=A0A3A8JD54_9BACT|nr:alpha/beta fold hydrolase [Corallococcus terminator]RKG93767.1 alpha/beta fold hydrolase [Corallococcus terminator]
MTERSGARGAILMVHGVGCTGEVWSRMAGHFREVGWRVETPTLRPHLRLGSAPPAELLGVRLADYVDDMDLEARRLRAETGRLPIVFGHSMGGLLAQKLAERGMTRAVVLLASTAPSGLPRKATLAPRFIFANILYSLRPEARAHRFWKAGFSWGMLNCVPRARHARLYEGTCYDSGLVYQDLFYRARDPQRTGYVDEARIEVPVLTIGAARDRVIPIETQRLVADKYRQIGKYLEYAHHAHWIVDEPGTERVIADIAAWLDEKVAR